MICRQVPSPNLLHLQEDPDKSDRLFITIDTVLNVEPLSQLVGTCDVVVHLAAAVGVQYVLENPLSSILTNVQGTERVLELCDKFRKKVLIASTSGSVWQAHPCAADRGG